MSSIIKTLLDLFLFLFPHDKKFGLYKVVCNLWYNRQEVDSSWKNKSKLQNKIFSCGFVFDKIDFKN